MSHTVPDVQYTAIAPCIPKKPIGCARHLTNGVMLTLQACASTCRLSTKRGYTSQCFGMGYMTDICRHEN